VIYTTCKIRLFDNYFCGKPRLYLIYICTCACLGLFTFATGKMSGLWLVYNTRDIINSYGYKSDANIV
jgi:hypothetical protein